MKKSTKAIAAFCLFNSASIYALGIGEIETSSSLNQVLKAKIPLVSSKNEDPENIRIALASRDAFTKVGIDRPHYLTELKFTPIVSKDGEIAIEVLSKGTIKEPFVNFLLEVEWPDGRTLKEFTILLDPPVTMSNTQTTAIEVATSPTPVPLPKTQTTTSQPSTQKTYAATASQPVQATAYGPTKNNDTMWGIAKGLIKDNNTVTHQQMMMALYNNNPSAFYKKNINALKRGAILNIPDRDQVNALTPTQATNEFVNQNNLWSSSTASNTAPATVKKDTGTQQTSTTTDTKKKPETNAEESQLTLHTPTDEEKQSIDVNGNAAETPVDSNNAQANAAIEMATTLEEQNKDLTSRLSGLETQVDKLQRLLALKNEQLTQLQSAKPKQTQSTTPSTEDDSNLTAYAGGGLLIALLALLMINRRKKKPETEAASVAIEPTLETIHDDDSVNQVSSESELDDELDSEPQIPAVTEEIIEPVEETAIQTTSSNNPLAECDVFIAYGRYDQAEDLIQKALADSPDNLSYKLKLLDIYHAANKPAAFEELAESVLSDSELDTVDQEKVFEMGESICSNSSLFDTQVDDESIENEISPDDQREELPEFNFDSIPDTTQTEAPSDTADDSDKSSEFELDFSLIKDDTGNDDENTDDTESSSTICSDNTNISLAQAYIDMGDVDSAREALEEVIESGSEEDKGIAQKILEQL